MTIKPGGPEIKIMPLFQRASVRPDRRRGVVHSREIGVANKRTWTFKIEGKEHTVEIEHGGMWSLTGYRIITVDSKVVEQGRKLWDTGSEHRFEIDKKSCIARIRYVVFNYDYEFWLDGKLL